MAGRNFEFNREVFDSIINDYLNIISWKDIVLKYNIPQSTIFKYLSQEYDFDKIKTKRKRLEFDKKIDFILENNSDIKLLENLDHTLTFEEYEGNNMIKGYYFVKCNICGKYTSRTFDSTHNHKNFSCMNCRNKKISKSQLIDYEVAIKRVKDLNCIISLDKKNLLSKNEWGRVIDKYWFTCSECDSWFLREYRAFVNGATKCRDCGVREWDISKAKKRIESLGGMLISEYWNNIETKYDFICPQCNCTFKRRFDKADLGRIVCYTCAREGANNKTKRFTPNEYKVYIKDNFNIECIDEYVNGRTPIYHKCPSCSEKWRVSPENLWYKRVVMCTRCSKECSSKGELMVEEVLKELNLEYLKEFTFKELGRYRYDFAIIDKSNNVIFLIEFDGVQHHEPVEMFGGTEEFEKTKKRDKKKNKYCKDNNIPLLRIPYWDINKVKDILINFMKEGDIVE